MNYRHLYHAGNFADVVKHVVLLATLTALQRKATGYCYVDTHAGSGLYQLDSVAAQKTQEYQRGVALLLAQDATSLPAVVQRYLALVRDYNPQAELVCYPGSPLLARAVARAQDRLLLCELQPAELVKLKQQFARDKQVAVHHYNGYQALKAFLPPREQRGVVLIDPPFEAQDEFTQISQGLAVALKQWPNGVYVLWYPCKEARQVAQFQRQLAHLAVSHVHVEFALLESLTAQLTACGVTLINPPWQLSEALDRDVLPCLAQVLHARYQMSNVLV